MTKEKFLYGLNACAVTYHNGQKLYDHDELVKCFEDLGMFEQEPILDKIRAEIEEAIKVDPYRLYAAIEIIDKYKAESEDKE